MFIWFFPAVYWKKMARVFLVKFYYFEIYSVIISKYQSKQYKLDIHKPSNVIVLRYVIL